MEALNNYQREFDQLHNLLCYVSGDASKKALIPNADNQPVNVAAILLQVVPAFPSLFLTVTPERLWKLRIGAEETTHYRFRDPDFAGANLRSILARIAFLIKEEQDEQLNRQLPPPAYLRNYLDGRTGIPQIHQQQAQLYLLNREKEAERRGIQPANAYGFEIERLHTDSRGDHWCVTIETQNNMTKGPPYLKTTSRPVRALPE